MQRNDSNSEFHLPSYLDKKRQVIHHALKDIIDNTFSDTRIASAMQYSLMASGKRLRPVLCMAAAEVVGNINKDVITAACAIEMIHTYSLIHDDLPAMDDDQLRRGKPTCHIQYDVATALLAGDALLTLAFEILSQDTDSPENAPARLRVIHIIARAAGFKGMIEGQMRDIAAETTPVTADGLKEIHQRKTGALIEASVISGALLAGGTSASIECLKNYAQNIGFAFQVVDDILNIEGNAAKMGKAVGTDAARNKSTYPSLLGLDASRQFAHELVNNALHVLDIFANKADPLSALARYIIQRER